ncbi:MAG: hypothetical protein P8X74_23530, partial [Reinekea sp.]
MSLFTDVGSDEGYEEEVYVDGDTPAIGAGCRLNNKAILTEALKQMGYSTTSLGVNNFNDLLEDLSEEFSSTNNWTESNKDTKMETVNTQVSEFISPCGLHRQRKRIQLQTLHKKCRNFFIYRRHDPIHIAFTLARDSLQC